MMSVNVKPKCLLLFTDLDGTYTPLDIPGMIDFIQVIREIRDRTGVAVKFCPISRDPAGYVLRTLHQARDLLAGAGLHNICEFGAAESGAVIVDSSRSYGPKYMGRPENRNFKQKIVDILSRSPYSRIICDEPDKLFTCSIHVRNEYREDLSDEETNEIFSSIRQQIVAELGRNNVQTPQSQECLDVMTKEIGKDVAIQHLITTYMRSHNVTGVIFAGTSENDSKAIRLVSKMAEIPGIQANVFLPANASKLIESRYLERWKTQNRNASTNRIRKAEEKLFRGVTTLIRKALKEEWLLGTGVVDWHTRDDSYLPNRIVSTRLTKVPTVTTLSTRIPKEFLLPHRDIRVKQVRMALENLAAVGMMFNSSSTPLTKDPKKLWPDDKKNFLVQTGLRIATAVPI